MFSCNFVGNILSKLKVVSNITCVNRLSTFQRPVVKTQFPWQQNINKMQQGYSATLLQCQESSPLINLKSVRTIMRIHYRPNALKRIKKHGLEKRLVTRPQREILFRRIIKGRHSLTAFDRFMNQVPEKKSKTHKRVNLFDPKKGYKSAMKKVEYYRF